MIGTIHLDICAGRILFDLLRKLKPDCIAVEISSFSVIYRQKHQASWLRKLGSILKELPPSKRKHLRIRLLKRQLIMPFEWQVAKKYGNLSSIPVVPVDSGEISKRELPSWKDELLNTDNILLAVSEQDVSLDEYFSRHYNQAASHLLGRNESINQFIELVFDEQWCKREKTLAERIFGLCSTYKRVVYIGGWMHLLLHEDLPSLAKLTRAVTKERFLITGNKVRKI